MTPFDIALLVALAAFVLYGLSFGFIHTAGSLIGAVLGFWIGGALTEPIVAATGILFGGENLYRIVIFVLLFMLITRVTGLAVSLIDKFFDIAKLIPFVPSANRVLGAVLGFIEGLVIIGVALYFYSEQFGLPAFADGSLIAPLLKSSTGFIINVLT